MKFDIEIKILKIKLTSYLIAKKIGSKMKFSNKFQRRHLFYQFIFFQDYPREYFLKNYFNPGRFSLFSSQY
jgi:hypothetical protein